MENILNEIVAVKRVEIIALKEKYQIKDFEDFNFYHHPCLSLKDSILQKEFGIIAEIKRKSPSAGEIGVQFDLLKLAKTYVDQGVAGISVLTDFNYFGGQNNDLTKIKSEYSIPLLRKEFIIDEIQIFESKAIGADAILLIAEILSPQQVKDFTIIAKGLGLEVIMELHDFQELEKIYEEVDILGINNRNLKLQKTNLDTSFSLAPFLPKNILKISESGIKTSEEIQKLAEIGYRGALIGESILINEEKNSFLKELVDGAK